MTTVRTLIQRHPLLTYFVLTFVISWGSILIVVGPGLLLGTKEIPDAMSPFVYLAMLLGPSVAGILLTGLAEGGKGLRELLSRLLRWRVGALWYVVALMTAPLLMAVVLLVLSLRSSEFLPAIATTDGKSTLLLSGLIAGLMVGLFEELGWTGFAIPRLLQRYNVLVSGVVVGLLWGAWHFLLFRQSDSFATPLAVSLLLARLFTWLPAYRVLLVWIYQRTESLLIVMLMHLSLVANTLILSPSATGGNLLIYILAWAALLWAAVIAVALADGRHWARPAFYKEMKVASH